MIERPTPPPGFDLQRDEVICSYAYLVDKIAMRLIARLPPNVELDDLKSAGMIGLIDAIGKYSDDKGSRFRVYAEIRIRGAIMDELRSQDWVPRSVRERKNNLQKKILQLTNILGRSPTDEEVAASLDICLADYYVLKRQTETKSMISFEDLKSKSDDGNGRDILESIPDHSQIDPASLTEQTTELKLVYHALKELPDRQRMVLSLYYFEDMKLKEIGSLLGVSESRVSQIQSNAMALLRPIIERLS